MLSVRTQKPSLETSSTCNRLRGRGQTEGAGQATTPYWLMEGADIKLSLLQLTKVHIKYPIGHNEYNYIEMNIITLPS